MIRERRIDGVRVILQARAIGGLGWTWCFEVEGQAEVRNEGPLEPSEEAAFDAALAAASMRVARWASTRDRQSPQGLYQRAAPDEAAPGFRPPE